MRGMIEFYIIFGCFMTTFHLVFKSGSIRLHFKRKEQAISWRIYDSFTLILGIALMIAVWPFVILLMCRKSFKYFKPTKSVKRFTRVKFKK
jgi:hypothetical protein